MKRPIAIALILVGVLNFTSFMAFTLSLGGSAGNGEIRDGRCYVNEHGKETEVSSRTFRLNQIHGRTLWITHPLAMLGILLFSASEKSTRRARRLEKHEPR
jgi:hypothetical protein